MNTVYWVDPDTLRISPNGEEGTGLLRFEGNGIEVTVELYDTRPRTIGPYIQRTIQLFDSFPIITNATEPEPEPTSPPGDPEPEPEEPIWADFIDYQWQYPFIDHQWQHA